MSAIIALRNLEKSYAHGSCRTTRVLTGRTRRGQGAPSR
jgi:hypothetical protein